MGRRGEREGRDAGLSGVGGWDSGRVIKEVRRTRETR